MKQSENMLALAWPNIFAELAEAGETHSRA
jgi:hypothetical protein